MTAQYRLSFKDDENVLQLDSGDGHTLLNTLKIIEFCTLYYTNYISIMLLKRIHVLKDDPDPPTPEKGLKYFICLSLEGGIVHALGEVI